MQLSLAICINNICVCQVQQLLSQRVHGIPRFSSIVRMSSSDIFLLIAYFKQASRNGVGLYFPHILIHNNYSHYLLLITIMQNYAVAICFVAYGANVVVDG